MKHKKGLSPPRNCNATEPCAWRRKVKNQCFDLTWCKFLRWNKHDRKGKVKGDW